MEHFETGDTAFLAGDALQTIRGGAEDGLAKGPDDSNPRNRPDERFGSNHPGVVQFAFLDGHVDPLRRDMEASALMAWSTVGGGEVVQQ
jgi:prepilin-type processing-associated H-X9-DG protein